MVFTFCIQVSDLLEVIFVQGVRSVFKLLLLFIFCLCMSHCFLPICRKDFLYSISLS